MPVSDLVYKTRDELVAAILQGWEDRVPGVNTGPDSIINMDAQVLAEVLEGLFLQAQLLHDDMFIQTASALALQNFGDEFGRPQGGGAIATGNVRFSGQGGTYIPIGTQVGAPRPSADDELIYETTADATIPAPGIPTAPVAADSGVAGNPNGTYEYAVSFVTAEGETALGAVSNAQVVVNHQVTLTSIPIGGVGTTGRNVYRRLNGGTWGLLVAIGDNTTTGYTDNLASTLANEPLTVSTAERVTVAAQATEVGTDYNADIGTITDLVGDPASGIVEGLSDVTNVSPFTGGADEEDIEDFRQALLEWVRAPGSGSPDDLIAWAETVSGVESASVDVGHDLSGASAPGTVSVRISGPGGTIPDSTVITAVQDELDSHNLANITILVGTFTADPQNITVTVTPQTGYVLADITAAVQDAITTYVASVPVGGTVYASGILAAVFNTAGVQNVTTTYTDTVIPAGDKATIGTITVS